MLRIIDVLVFTPIPEELAALTQELGEPDREEIRDYFSYKVWNHVTLKDRGSKGRLVALLPPDKDQLPASNTIHLALQMWLPRCVALVGIAGALAGTELGDVIVARDVLQYDAKRKIHGSPNGIPQEDLSIVPHDPGT